MKKWLRRILWLLASGLVLSAGAAVLGYRQITRTPDWYAPPPVDSPEWSAAANRADQKVAQTLSWAAEVHAHRVRMRRAAAVGTTLPSADAAPGPRSISFTDTELNAFFVKWANAPTGVPEKIAQFAEGLRLYIQNGKLILAGKLIKTGIIASVQLLPSIDSSGRLLLALQEVDAGCLPVPRSFLPLDSVRGGLLEDLPRWQDDAAFAPDGIANESAIAAETAKLFLHTMDGSAAPAVAFLPSDVTRLKRAIPVKMTAISLSDHTLNATIDELSDAERQALLESIKASYSGAGDDGK
jgi:hypothetical protein